MAGNVSNSASSLSKLQSLNGLFALYKKQGPTSADVLNKLKETLLKGNATGQQQEISLLSFVEADSEMCLCRLSFRSWWTKPKPAKEKEAEAEDGARRDAGQCCQRGAG